MSSRIAALAVAGLGALGAAQAAPQTRYTLADLGTSSFYGYDSSRKGANAGTIYVNNASRAAILHADGRLTRVKDLGGDSSEGTGINDNGQIIGYSATPGHGADHAFVSTGGVTTDLGTLSGAAGDISVPAAINNAGQIVGFSGLPGLVGHRCFLWYDGTMADLGLLPGTRTCNANGINSLGHVVGDTFDYDKGSRAFLYRDGQMIDLGTVNGAIHANAYAVNDSDQIVGKVATTFSYSPYYYDAFYYDAGVMTDIGRLHPTDDEAGGTAINKHGVAIGFSSNYGFNQYWAFVVFDGQHMIDLDTLLDDAAGWHVTHAFGLQDNGVITANATYEGATHTVRLTPVAAR